MYQTYIRGFRTFQHSFQHGNLYNGKGINQYDIFLIAVIVEYAKEL